MTSGAQLIGLTMPRVVGRRLQLGFVTRSGDPHVFYSDRPTLRKIARALLAFVGDEAGSPSMHELLDHFRAARIEVQSLGVSPAEAAAKHAIDPDMFAAWLSRFPTSI